LRQQAKQCLDGGLVVTKEEWIDSLNDKLKLLEHDVVFLGIQMDVEDFQKAPNGGVIRVLPTKSVKPLIEAFICDIRDIILSQKEKFSKELEREQNDRRLIQIAQKTAKSFSERKAKKLPPEQTAD